REPLLAGDASYSNIYCGGAKTTRLCAETLPEEAKELVLRPLRTLGIAALYSPTVLRIAALAAAELALAVGDMMRGLWKREDWRIEGKFLASRVGVSIVLREYVRVLLKLAIEEGTPIIGANFLGYVEQTHRRGPGSWFAHWSLKGIDDVIGDVFRTARRSPAREYEVIVFSDHGQQATDPYERMHGRTIDEAVRRALDGEPALPAAASRRQNGGRREWLRDQRALGLWARRAPAPEPAGDANPTEPDQIVVTALGPLGHIYLPTPLDDEAKLRVASRLVHEGETPLVAFRDLTGATWAVNVRGAWRLPQQASEVLGPDHPFVAEVGEDLAALAAHADAGDLLILGWNGSRKGVTFVDENGAHGSVSPEEVRGFALIPDAAPIPRRYTAAGEEYVRGEDLYQGGRQFVGAGEKPRRPAPRPQRSSDGGAGTFRVMTYNIHSCLGVDGKLSFARIARVIASARADVVALQEVDCRRRRSQRADQAAAIAEQLEMHSLYFPVLDVDGEQYGLAVLSRWPLTQVRASYLTTADPRRRREARGARSRHALGTIANHQHALRPLRRGASSTSRRARQRGLARRHCGGVAGGALRRSQCQPAFGRSPHDLATPARRGANPARRTCQGDVSIVGPGTTPGLPVRVASARRDGGHPTQDADGGDRLRSSAAVR
ncbi:MAG TPA: endonuclease/exonuclease/phosphatase family protein, partial [Lacipirellulaceae bacterium]|nr:endonuclease/exonuclease/phosphatase family protein [Lacipirellulaceae bacterium]